MIQRHNLYNNNDIVSFDPNKTWIEQDEKNLILFCKKTNIKELKNLKKAEKLLLNKHVIINNKIYDINTPEIIKWDKNNKVIYLKYIEGDNLELILRNVNTHKNGVSILNELLNFFIDNQIFWADFAPRNIIIQENKIYILDFEKGIKTGITKIEYLRFNVLEEYSLFLLEKERLYNINDILFCSREKNIKYKFEPFKDKRFVYIGKELGCKNSLDKRTYLFILEQIIKIETPKLIDKALYFPGVELDKYFIHNEKEKALFLYSKEIVKLIKDNVNHI